MEDNRKMSIRTQNKINITNPGLAESDFITSEIFSIRRSSFFVYLSLSPLNIKKQILSNVLILRLFSSLSLLKKNDDYYVTYSKYWVKRSLLPCCTTQLIILVQYLRVYLDQVKKSSLLNAFKIDSLYAFIKIYLAFSN